MDPLIGRFLEESPYIDYRSPLIRSAATQLFEDGRPAVERAETAYVFVRDEIPHSFDCRSGIVTAKASDVLRHRTGICHAKANLLAALLRSQGIPTGFCYQHITLADDDSLGYCVHAFNAVYLDGHWIRLDARGNTGGIDARFSLDKPVLAFRNRPSYDEYFWNGIYACPHPAAMALLEASKTLDEVQRGLPKTVTQLPDIEE
ncbi:MAG: transglutaminase family protein [Clostridiales bacterium]|nr:transglutaminase family protein [Clostridiales bacterium]